jgi:4-amino-4-deoxy-L-arabinose transferase-like glycosyltransferase
LGKVSLNISWEKRVLIIAILAGVMLRLWSCFEAFGIWWKGDEAEYVNMAWLMVHRYGWPSLDLRSPFYPLLLALPIKTASTFGIYGNDVMLMCRIFNSIFSITLIFSLYFFAKKIYSEKVATIATILMSFSAPIVEWTPRVMTEIHAVSFAVLSFAVAVYSLKSKSFSMMLIAGSLLGFSYLTRFNYAIFLIPLVLYLLVQKEGCLAFGMTLGFLLVFIFGGALDYLIWGKFLNAPIRFFEVNVIAGFEHTGLDPLYYIRNMAWYMTFVGIVLGILGLKKNRETILMLGLIGSYLFMVSFTANYDLRYGLILVPLILILAGNGVLKIGGYLKMVSAKFPSTKSIMALLPFLVLLAMICLSLIQAINSPYIYNEDATKAALYLNEQPDVKGVIVVDYACKMGEYIFLQKNVPIYEYTTQNLSILKDFCQNANYVIVINEWYFQINPTANETIRNYGFCEIQRYDSIYVLKKP